MKGFSNLEKALQFLQMTAAGKVREAFDKYVATYFVHHNPYLPGDRDSLIKAIEADFVKHPHKRLEVEITMLDVDKVAIYLKVFKAPQEPEIRVAHFFRFEDEMIVEMWDVAMKAPPKK